MSKEQFFDLYAPYVREDGTYDELLDVFMRHPQTNPDILKRSCDWISDYINFSMDSSISYYSKSNGDYRQFFKDKEDREVEKWQITLYGTSERIYPDTDLSTITYPNIKRIMSMNALYRKDKTKLTEEERIRYETYRVPYGFLFSYLLDGYFV